MHDLKLKNPPFTFNPHSVKWPWKEINLHYWAFTVFLFDKHKLRQYTTIIYPRKISIFKIKLSCLHVILSMTLLCICAWALCEQNRLLQVRHAKIWTLREEELCCCSSSSTCHFLSNWPLASDCSAYDGRNVTIWAGPWQWFQDWHNWFNVSWDGNL